MGVLDLTKVVKAAKVGAKAGERSIFFKKQVGFSPAQEAQIKKEADVLTEQGKVPGLLKEQAGGPLSLETRMDYSNVVSASKVEELAVEEIAIEAPKLETKVMPHQIEMPFPNLVEMKMNPEYWAKHKGKKYKEVLMTPDEYMQEISKGFGMSVKTVTDDADKKLVDEYSNAMIRGDKFPKLVLDISGYFGQEGRHRALAAKQAGYEKVPVVVIESTR